MRRITSFSAASILMALAGSAAASSPHAVFSVPTQVELLPDEATATRVVIRGAFVFLQSPPFNYSQPACGFMYFQCRAGQEEMCRLQWEDIRRSIGGVTCTGFGQMQMSTTARLRPVTEPLGTPDPWELGLGVSPGSHVDGKCPLARALTCPPGGTPMPAPDASSPAAPDAGAAPSDTAAPPAPDAPPASAAPVAPVVDASVAPAVDAPVAPAADAGAALATKSDGCAYGGGAGPGGWVLLLALGLLVRRVRRR